MKKNTDFEEETTQRQGSLDLNRFSQNILYLFYLLFQFEMHNKREDANQNIQPKPLLIKTENLDDQNRQNNKIIGQLPIHIISNNLLSKHDKLLFLILIL